MFTTISNFFFFFNDTATTEIYTLSLHDALPISDGRAAVGVARKAERRRDRGAGTQPRAHLRRRGDRDASSGDRKSTRLNSSHSQNSYAVFCLKKKNRMKL